MTLTNSWLQKAISDIEATRDEIPFGLDEDGNNTLAALKMALAGMEADPVGYMNRFTGRVFTVEEQPGADTDAQVYVPVYAAPQPITTSERAELENYRNAQQVVPECHQRLLHHAYGMTMGHDWNKGTMAGHHREKLRKAVEDCRAAMLQGAESVESRCTIQTASALDSSPKIAESRCRNSPVTPDGYVLVPKEITCAMDDAAWEAYHETRCMSDIWAALLAASAPQQESE